MEKQKATLLDAYVRKVIALGKIYVIESTLGETDPSKRPLVNLEDIDTIFLEVGKFIDTNDPKVSLNYTQLLRLYSLYLFCSYSNSNRSRFFHCGMPTQNSNMAE